MKKKFLIILVIIVSLFVTGCGNNSKLNGSTKNNKQIVDFLLNNIIDDNNKSPENHFYMFSKDGKFIYNNSTEIKFKMAKVILFINGTWKLNGNNLVLKQEEIVYQSLDSTKTEYVLEYQTIDNTIEYKDLKLESNSMGVQYLNGDKCSIFKKTNKNKDYLNEIRHYLESDINNVNLENLKKLEAK